MASVKTYDPKSVTITVGEFPIGGFADGVFVKAMRSEDTFSKSTGADGDTTRVKSNDKSGEITITLAMSSPSNDDLSTIAVRDEISNDGIVPVSIKDVDTKTELVSGFAWVRKQPEVEFSKEVSDREWILDVADMTQFTGGNTPAE